MPYLLAAVSGDETWHLIKGIASAAAGLTVLVIEFLKHNRHRKVSQPLPHIIWARLDQLERRLAQSTEPLPAQSPTSMTVDYEYLRARLARLEAKLAASQARRRTLRHALYEARKDIDRLRTDLSAARKLVVVPPPPTGT